MQFDAEKAMKDIVSKGIKLPTQPRVLIELQAKLNSDDYSMRELAQIIARDPGITAMLFKALGSPVFSHSKKLDSLEQVLMVIGVKQTCNLVQAVALANTISDSSRKSFEIFWTRSQEVAQIAALVAAERVSICNIFPDQAYMAGIFFECGVPVLMQRFPAYCDKVKLDHACCWPNLSEEDKHFQLDHCSVGYLVARHWKLPDFVCQAILYHHEVPHDDHGAVRSLVAILQLATHIYHRVSRVEDPLWPKLRMEVLAELGIHEEDEQEFYDEIGERFTNA